MSTMREVASYAGVSQKTVSRVFRNDPHVTPETREKVTKALAELRYTPNALATTFRAGRAPVIGIAVPDIVDPFFAAIIRAVDEVAAEHDMSTLVTDLADDPDREASRVESLLRRSLSGLIVASTRDEQGYLRLWNDKLPIVSVDRQPSGLLSDSVTEDDQGGGRLATDHLISHGHQRIAFLSDRLGLTTTKGRLAGYQDALAAADMPYRDEYVVLGVTDGEKARLAVAELIALPNPPTAVFSANSRTTMFLIPSLHEQNLGLVSFGDFPMAGELRTPLTAIDQDPAQVGRLAAQRIVGRLAPAGSSQPQAMVLDVHLIERASCAVGVPRAAESN